MGHHFPCVTAAPPRVFRSSRAFLAYLTVQALFLAGAAVLLWRTAGWDWLSVVMAGAAMFIGVGGLAEALRTRVVLERDALELTTLWGTHRIPKSEVRAVRAERRVPPAVQLADGTWIRLPSLGRQLAHAVQAWLEASPET